jgi:uncharacterized membrane protein
MTIEKPELTSPGKFKRWGLIASLALNLLLIGLIAGGIWRVRHHGQILGGDLGLMGFVRHLPADRQPEIREQLLSAGKNLMPLRKDVQEAWMMANSVLATEPFDKETLKAALAKSRETTARVEEAMASVFAETAAKLTPTERKALQAWREKHKPRFFGRHGKHGPEGAAGVGDEKAR